MQSREFDTLASELAQPIAALALLTRALRLRSAGGEAEIILDDIDAGLCQLRRRLSSLVDLMRAEHCLADMERTSFALMPIFGRLALQTDRLVHENRVRLSIVSTGTHVVSDPAAVELILRSFLMNALFFAPGGRVLLGCRRRGNTVEIQVRDDGVGISGEDLALVFEPLRKLARDGEDLMEGLGLGLTIARDLAQALGHDLVVRSAPSRGSVFSLSVPGAMPGGNTGSARA